MREITVAPGVLCFEIPEKPAFPWLGVEFTDSLPCSLKSLGGVIGVISMVEYVGTDPGSQ
ncbi:MAG: hypothetical protein J07HQW1_03051 [Haloquadratum walsbyi J07HQW1]|uniref:Uncharacterized protein n=1 Tax=Haloquadratum walsbyi J07HQW1 TaxID=1238424 RepID=U1N8Z4_9EURY|nr:MAG: hypothetical protein J07HQW1_03051 [Haloquadratum walsbyi J07HQW1]